MSLSVRKFLNKRNFKFLSLDLETIGDYSPHDSEWNYGDVLHFPYIHKVFDQKILNLSDTTNTSYFIQKIFFFTSNPIIIYQEHNKKDTHEYLTSSYGITISIITKHLPHKTGARTTTNYHFYYSGFIGYLVALFARFVTKSNYKKVIDEDMPMRLQRGKLRKSNKIEFRHDDILVTPISTSNSSDNNVSIKDSVYFSKVINISQDMKEINFDDVFLKVVVNNNIAHIYPTICPHEGSPLVSEKIKFKCKWHGRLIKPYYSFDFNKKSDKSSFIHLNRGFSLIITKNINTFKCQIMLNK